MKIDIYEDRAFFAKINKYISIDTFEGNKGSLKFVMNYLKDKHNYIYSDSASGQDINPTYFNRMDECRYMAFTSSNFISHSKSQNEVLELYNKPYVLFIKLNKYLELIDIIESNTIDFKNKPKLIQDLII